jgi:hypothetical protein
MASEEEIGACESLERLKESYPELSSAAKILSKYPIAQGGEDLFVREYADKLEGGAREARQIYRTAFNIQEKAALIWANVRDTVSPYYNQTIFNNLPEDFLDHLQSLPEYDRLFGSLDYVSCDHCRSIFGPAAYFADLMRFVNTYISGGNSSGIPTDCTLKYRRPDLYKMRLDCGNSTDLIPQIDLVNELLEAFVTKEYDQDAYLAAKDAVFPQSLPFNRPLEEIRSYLKRYDTSLYQIYNTLAKQYMFSWNEIPGEDNEILVKFLTQKFGIDWVKTAEIEKIDDDKTIKVSTEKNSLSLKLNDKKTEVILEIDDGRSNNFIAKLENDALNIYAKSFESRPFDEKIPQLKSILSREFLELSPKDFCLLTSEISSPEDISGFYGGVPLTGINGLDNVDVLLEQTRLTRTELNELLFQDLSRHEINAGLSRLFFINSVDDGLEPLALSQDESDGYDRLLNLSPRKLDRIYRFLKLSRKLGWSFADLDWSLRTLHEPYAPEKVLKFDGINDYVACLDAVKLDLPKLDAFTIEAWINPDSSGRNAIVGLLANRSDGSKFHILLEVDPFDKLVFRIGQQDAAMSDFAKKFEIVSNSSLSLNNFTHIAVVAENGKTRLYINGKIDREMNEEEALATPFAGPDPDPSVHIDMNIGKDLFDEYFDGCIKDVRVWGIARDSLAIEEDRYHRFTGRENDLIGYWPLTEDQWVDLLDLTPGGTHGVLGGGEFIAQPKWVYRDLILDPLPFKGDGFLFQFNGVDQYMAARGVDIAATKEFSLEAWVKIEAQQDNCIVCLGDDSLKPKLAMLVNASGKLAFQVGSSPQTYESSNLNPILLDKLTHFCIVLKEVTEDDEQISKLEMYINGVLDNSRTISPQITLGLDNGEMNVGRSFDGSYFQGGIKEIRMWSTARTKDQIALYMYRPVPSDDSKLIGYWRLNEAEEGAARDLSYHRNDLHLGGLRADYMPTPVTTEVLPKVFPVPANGTVLQFDGDNDVIAIKNDKNWGLGRYERMTLELWFKATTPAHPDRNQVIFTQGDIEAGLNIYLKDGSLYVLEWNNSLERDSLRQSILKAQITEDDDPTWHHVAMTHNEFTQEEPENGSIPVEGDIELRAYLDGERMVECEVCLNNICQLVGDDDFHGYRLSPVGTAYLGGLGKKGITCFKDEYSQPNSEHLYFFAGQVADLRIWNSVKSAEEIADDCHRHLAPQITEDLVTYMPMVPMDEGSGGIILGWPEEPEEKRYKGIFQDREIAQVTSNADLQLINIYSHYFDPEENPTALEWKDYYYSGRMRITDGNAAVGVTILSRHPEGIDQCYIFGRDKDHPRFRLFAHPSGVQTLKPATESDTIESAVTPQVNVWYRFLIKVQCGSNETGINARVWPEDSPEPTDFLLNAVDESDIHITKGTVGLWSSGSDTGQRQFDNLRVWPTSISDPITSDLYLNFEDQSQLPEPENWLDTEDRLKPVAAGGLFKQISVAGGTAGETAFGTDSTDDNIHSYYSPGGSGVNPLSWNNYVYLGRMRISDADGGIGVTFLSRQPDGVDQYYALRRDAEQGTFKIFAHPQGVQTIRSYDPVTDMRDSGVRPLPNVWYRFQVNIQNGEGSTRIQAKIWAETDIMPNAFQIDAVDDSGICIKSGTVGIWASGSGSKYFDSLRVYSKIYMSESFERYSANQDPLNWRDTRDHYSSYVDDSLFKVFLDGGRKVFGTTSTDDFIHSHYTGSGASGWSNYIYMGRMRLSNVPNPAFSGGIGVTFLSQYLPGLTKRHYKIIYNPDDTDDILRRSFCVVSYPQLSPSPLKGTISSNVAPIPNTWYRFLIEVEDAGSRTNIRAKIWPESAAEPSDYQIVAYDESVNRLKSGTVGVVTVDTGPKYFDDLEVVEEILLSPISVPVGWVDVGSRVYEEDEDLFGTVDLSDNIPIWTDIIEENYPVLLHPLSRSALMFDGLLQYLASRTSPEQNHSIKLSQFTLEAWISLSEIKESPILSLSGNLNGNDATIVFGTDNLGRLRLWQRPDLQLALSSGDPLAIDQFVHVAVRVKASDAPGDRVTFFVNGGAVLTSVPSPNLPDSFLLEILRGEIGRDGGDQHFHGRIKEVRIWNRALEANEIALQMYQRPVGSSGLVGYWSLGKDGENTVEDLSPSENPMRLGGLEEDRRPVLIDLNAPYNGFWRPDRRVLDFKLDFKGGYVFSWGKVPGNDEGRFIEFLANKFGIDWVKTAKIEKIDNGRTIKVSDEENSLSLKLNDEDTKVILEIDDGQRNEFLAEMENGELNIYSNHIILLTDESPGVVRQRRTVEVWFRVEDKWISSKKQVIYQEGNDKYGLCIYIHDGFLYFGGYNLNESQWQGTWLHTDRIESGRWHHCALVLDGRAEIRDESFQGFLDGKRVDAGPGSQIWGQRNTFALGGIRAETRFHDGSSGVASGHYFRGEILCLRIWDSARNASQIISNLYVSPDAVGSLLRIEPDLVRWEFDSATETWISDISERITRISKAPLSQDESLVLWWEFDGITDLTIRDLSQNGHTATFAQGQLQTIVLSPAYGLPELSLDAAALDGIAAIKRLKEAYEQPMDHLTALWYSINHVGKDGHTPLFDSIFNPKGAVIEPWDYYLDDPVRWDKTGAEDRKRDGQIRSRLMGALRVSHDDLNAIVEHISGSDENIIDLDSTYLWRMYQIASLASALQLNVKDLIQLLSVFHKGSIDSLQDVTEICDLAEWMKGTGLSVSALAYLTHDPADLEGISVSLFTEADVVSMAGSLMGQSSEILINSASFVSDLISQAQSADILTQLQILGLINGYVFSWGKIPGNDEGRLIEFLANKFGIDWVKTAKIEKIDNGRTIKVSDEENSLSLKLNDEDTKVILEIDDLRRDEFIAKMENDELNIYISDIGAVTPVYTDDYDLGGLLSTLADPDHGNWIHEFDTLAAEFDQIRTGLGSEIISRLQFHGFIDANGLVLDKSDGYGKDSLMIIFDGQTPDASTVNKLSRVTEVLELRKALQDQIVIDDGPVHTALRKSRDCLRRAVISELASLFGVQADMISAIFDYLDDNGEPDASLFIEEMKSLSESGSGLQEDLKIYFSKMSKLVYMAGSFELTDAGMGALLSHPDRFSFSNILQPTLRDLDNLYLFKRLQSAFEDTEGKLIDLLALEDAGAIENALDDLAGWEPRQVRSLVEHFGAPESRYNTIPGLSHLNECFDMAGSMQAGTDLLLQLADTTSLGTADEHSFYSRQSSGLLEVLRAGYTDEEWPGVYQPIYGELAEKRRDALLDLALERLPEYWMEYLFCLDGIPDGNSSLGNEELRIFLGRQLKLDWAEGGEEGASISRTDGTIRVSRGDKWAEIALGDTKAALSTDNGLALDLTINPELLFSWSDIPESSTRMKSSSELKALVNFLEKGLGLDWMDDAYIVKKSENEVGITNEASITDTDPREVTITLSAAPDDNDGTATLVAALVSEDTYTYYLRAKKESNVWKVYLRDIYRQNKFRKGPNIFQEYFLMDMQVGHEVETSRIVQGTAAVQYYIQRCLMNLEPGVDPFTIPQVEWEWVKNYRVWEANRKVFLYPENYIEPELRDTKTPFFEDLEQELLQSDINQESVEIAYIHYLDKFAEVANLKIVGSYLHTDLESYDPSDPDAPLKKVLYLVGRTATEPRMFYMREWISDEMGERWLPWEKIDLVINSDFVTPVYAFGKLFIFWSEFTKLKETEEVDDPKSDDPEKKITVDKDVFKATVKYSYYNLSKAWIQPQSYQELDRDLSDWEHRQLRWQRLAAQRLLNLSSLNIEPKEEKNAKVLLIDKETSLHKKVPESEMEYQKFDMNEMTWEFWAMFTNKCPDGLPAIVPPPGSTEEDYYKKTSRLVKYDDGVDGRFTVEAVHKVTAISDYLSKTSASSYVADKTQLALTYFDDANKSQGYDGVAECYSDPLLIDNLDVAFENHNGVRNLIDTARGSVLNWEQKALDASAAREEADDAFAAWSNYDGDPDEKNRLWGVYIALNAAADAAEAARNNAWSTARSDATVANIAAATSRDLELAKPKWKSESVTLSFEVAGHDPVLYNVDYGEWHHIAVTLQFEQGQGYTFKLYLQGEEISGLGQPLEGTSPLTSGELLTIGVQGDDVDDYFTAQMSEFRLWGQVRSETFIEGVMAIKYSMNERLDGSDGLLACLPLNEDVPGSAMNLTPSTLNFSLPIIKPLQNRIIDRERLILFYGDKILSLRNNLKDRSFEIKLKNINPKDIYDLDLCADFEGHNASLYLIESPELSIYDFSTEDKEEYKGYSNGIMFFFEFFNDYIMRLLDALRPQLTKGRPILTKLDARECIFIDVVNQPGWFILDTGDDQFLIKMVISSKDTQKELRIPTTEEMMIADYEDRSDRVISITFELEEDNPLIPDSQERLVQVRFERLNTYAINQLSENLFVGGIDKLLSIESQKTKELDFWEEYGPKGDYVSRSLNNILSTIDFKGAMRLYFEEVFFHVPFLIANSLNSNQKFEEAQKWYHYIFNPTADEEGGIQGKNKDRYWRYLPFRDDSFQSLRTLLTDEHALAAYREDPFDPHAIAALRMTAYKKAVVMKYIDNLLDWGDSLFMQDTRESINEALGLYIMAYDLLGPRPKVKTIKRFQDMGTYEDFIEDYQEDSEFYSEFLTAAEKIMPGNGGAAVLNPHSNIITDFCVPENEKFIGYWDLAEDRLYKIRHSMNFEGAFRQLALFAPPIEPMELVRSVAMGSGISGALADLNVAVPHYRYPFVVAMAKEMTSNVISLGSSLLDALEKKDAEHLANLQNSQERVILNLVTSIKENEINLAKETIAALEISKKSPEYKIKWYQEKINEYMNGEEIAELVLIGIGQVAKSTGAALKAISAATAGMPHLHSGAAGLASPVFITTYGGSNISEPCKYAAEICDISADIINTAANMTAKMGGYKRRKAGWEFDKNLAEKELEEIEKQIAGAKIQLAIANQELVSHSKTIQQNQDIEYFYRSKFSNEALYNWMVGRLSSLYFQSYKTAYDLAKSAEKALQYELPSTDTYITSVHWDGLRKGLLAGESLMLQIDQMEKSHLAQDSRFLEIEKTISMSRTFPGSLLLLMAKGACEFRLSEEIFDRDYPGHYFRVIKTVELTVVTSRELEPYQPVNVTLIQLGNKTLLQPHNGAVSYLLGQGSAEQPDTGILRVNWRANQQVAVSRVNERDDGMFNLDFVFDNRYFPFEGTGVVSSWRLEIPKASNPDLVIGSGSASTLDIQDVLIHIRYTAKSDRGSFKKEVETMLGIR